MSISLSAPRRLAGLAVGIGLGLAASTALAQSGSNETQGHEDTTPQAQHWSFAGPFGKFDRAQLQRGLKVYREVCSNCHSLKRVAFRNLAESGGPEFTEGQVKALAASYKVQDGPNDIGDMYERPGRPADHFPLSFPNDQAARAANGGAVPPDMSVLAKARGFSNGFPGFLINAVTMYQEQGPDYIHALITDGYVDPPPGTKLAPGTHYNKYMPGHAIAMPKPLSDGQVDYTDGSPATVDQYTKDVAAFLMWAAEPKLEARHEMGLKVILFLIVFAGLLILTKKKVWHAVDANWAGG